MTSELRPTSITVHSEYNAAKSLAKQRGVCDLLRQAGEYICTNSLLEESEFQTDMNLGAEYRLYAPPARLRLLPDRQPSVGATVRAQLSCWSVSTTALGCVRTT